MHLLVRYNKTSRRVEVLAHSNDTYTLEELIYPYKVADYHNGERDWEYRVEWRENFNYTEDWVAEVFNV